MGAGHRRAGYVFAFVKATDGYKGAGPIPQHRRQYGTGTSSRNVHGRVSLRPPGNPQRRGSCIFCECGATLLDHRLSQAGGSGNRASLGKATLSNWVHVWMATVKQLTGIEPIFYTYSNFTRYLDSSVTQYDFWLAHYTRDPTIALIPDCGTIGIFGNIRILAACPASVTLQLI